MARKNSIAEMPPGADPMLPVQPKPKPRADVFTLLLGISVLAMTIAGVLFFLSVAEHRKPGGSIPLPPPGMITLP